MHELNYCFIDISRNYAIFETWNVHAREYMDQWFTEYHPSTHTLTLAFSLERSTKKKKKHMTAFINSTIICIAPSYTLNEQFIVTFVAWKISFCATMCVLRCILRKKGTTNANSLWHRWMAALSCAVCQTIWKTFGINYKMTIFCKIMRSYELILILKIVVHNASNRLNCNTRI